MWAGGNAPVDPFKHDVFSTAVLIFEVRVHPSAQPLRVVCLCLHEPACNACKCHKTSLHQQASGLALSAVLLCRAGSQACQLRACPAGVACLKQGLTVHWESACSARRKRAAVLTCRPCSGPRPSATPTAPATPPCSQTTGCWCAACCAPPLHSSMYTCDCSFLLSYWAACALCAASVPRSHAHAAFGTSGDDWPLSPGALLALSHFMLLVLS